MVACELRIKCCVLENCCSFDGGFPQTVKSTKAVCVLNIQNNALLSCFLIFTFIFLLSSSNSNYYYAWSGLAISLKLCLIVVIASKFKKV